MQPIEDLAQFRALTRDLPPGEFNAKGIVHPRLSLFAATGRAADVEKISGLVADLPSNQDFTAAVARADADLRLYELDLANPSTALGASAASLTIAYGMTAIEPGPDLFALASLNDTQENFTIDDPLAALANSCSRDVCALLGALLACRMAGLPAIIDGDAALQAAQLLHALNEDCVSHCAVPQGSRIEATASGLGIRIVRCNDQRAFYALADAIVHTKALMPV